MIRIFYIGILVSIFTNSFGQKINYSDNLTAALQKAEQAKKPVFVYVTAPIPPIKTPGMPAFKSGLDEPDIAEFYNKNFVSLKFNFTDSAFVSFWRLYPTKINNYPAYIFLDYKGQLLFKKTGINTSLGQQYANMGNEVLKLASSGKTITDFKQKQLNGKLSHEELKEFIELRQQLELYDNIALVDEYVSSMTINELNNYQQVLFILKTGPIVYGKTYNLCYTNRKIVDSIFKTEPSAIRREINARIMTNSRNEAIRLKDVNLARQLSGFVQSAWGKQYSRGAKAAGEELLYYYNAVKDTANYYRQAVYFYDTHYMKLSVDSINKLSESAKASSQQAMMEQLRQMNPNAKIIEGANPGSVKVSGTNLAPATSIISSTNTVDVPGVLNNAAFTFYTKGTRNPEYLTKAMLWCKRAIELSPNNHAAYDTMAHLLYRLGFFDEAVSNQKKAIELAQNDRIINASFYITQLKSELKKMEERKL